MEDLTRISDHFPTNSMGLSEEPLHTGISVMALVSNVSMGHLFVTMNGNSMTYLILIVPGELACAH